MVIDDCLASDVSAWTTLDLMKRRYPSIRNAIVAVSAATQRGVESLIDDWKSMNSREWKGMGLRIKAAVPVFAMNPHFYLMRTPEEGYPDDTFYVGDMGRWAAPLDHRYDTEAVWNIHRQ